METGKISKIDQAPEKKVGGISQDKFVEAGETALDHKLSVMKDMAAEESLIIAAGLYFFLL